MPLTCLPERQCRQEHQDPNLPAAGRDSQGIDFQYFILRVT